MATNKNKERHGDLFLHTLDTNKVSVELFDGKKIKLTYKLDNGNVVQLKKFFLPLLFVIAQSTDGLGSKTKVNDDEKKDDEDAKDNDNPDNFQKYMFLATDKFPEDMPKKKIDEIKEKQRLALANWEKIQQKIELFFAANITNPLLNVNKKLQSNAKAFFDKQKDRLNIVKAKKEELQVQLGRALTSDEINKVNNDVNTDIYHQWVCTQISCPLSKNDRDGQHNGEVDKEEEEEVAEDNAGMIFSVKKHVWGEVKFDNQKKIHPHIQEIIDVGKPGPNEEYAKLAKLVEDNANNPRFRLQPREQKIYDMGPDIQNPWYEAATTVRDKLDKDINPKPLAYNYIPVYEPVYDEKTGKRKVNVERNKPFDKWSKYGDMVQVLVDPNIFLNGKLFGDTLYVESVLAEVPSKFTDGVRRQPNFETNIETVNDGKHTADVGDQEAEGNDNNNNQNKKPKTSKEDEAGSEEDKEEAEDGDDNQ